MAPPSLIANGGAAGAELVPAPVTGRFVSVYSEVQASLIDHALPLPSVLRKPFKVVDGPGSSAAGNPEEIAKLFPNVFGPGAKRFRFGCTGAEVEDRCCFIWRPSARRAQCDFWNFRLLARPRQRKHNVAAKKLTLKNVTDHIVNVILRRADLGYNYGIILIPEGLIDFSPEVQQLIAELNEILAHEVVDEDGLWKKKLTSQSLELFDFLPEAIQEQLMLEGDPHGNVQVAKIETEKMLIQMVETDLEKRKQEGSYNGQFQGQSHFFGYEGRCGLPTNFDSTYCYALGYAAGALLHSGKTGLISSVGNLDAPVEEWTVGGTALTSLMDVERRHGKFKPVIKKAMVELEGAPFKKFASLRNDWAINNRYISPGPIQFHGQASNALSHTLLLELGVSV